MQWDLTTPDLTEALFSAISEEAIPFLSGLDSASNIAKAIMRFRGRSSIASVHQAIAYSFALAGETKKALASLDHMVSLLSDHENDREWRKEIVDRSNTLREALLHDRQSVLALLDGWRQETVHNLKLS